MRTYADIYDRMFHAFDGDFKQITEFIEGLPEGPIGEIGAGSGRLLPVYENLNKKVTLVEPDEAMLLHLSKRVTGKSHDIVNKSSVSKPLIANTYSGIIFAFGGICEMHPLLFTVSEAAKALKVGGKLFIASVNPANFETGSNGLGRSISGKLEMSVSAETVRKRSCSNYEFEVAVVDRHIGHINKHTIEQIIPPFEWWTTVSERLDMSIEKVHGSFSADPFEPKHSPMMVMTIVKNSPKKASGPVENVYDGMAPLYSSTVKGSNYGVPDWLRGRLEVYRGYHPRVLDLGCSDGWLADFLHQLNVEPSLLFGSDISATMLEIAEKKNRHNGLVKLDLNDGFPELQSRLFDITLSIGVMEFIENPKELLKDIYRTLDIGGILLATFEYSEFSAEHSTQSKWGPVVRKSYTEEEVRSIVSDSGFEISQLFIAHGYTSPSSKKDVPYIYLEAKKVNHELP